MASNSSSTEQEGGGVGCGERCRTSEASSSGKSIESVFSTAIAIINPRIRDTAMARALRTATRGTRVADSLKADVVISTADGACAFQVHVNFSHAHVADAIKRAEALAGNFERCYVLLARPNTNALQNFQLQLSPTCDARPLLVASEDGIIPEIRRVSEGVLDPAVKGMRKKYYKQVQRGLRHDQPHRGILAELLRGLGVLEWRQEADLLLDTFGSIRGVCLQPLSALLADCPIAGDTARTLHAFFNETPDPPLKCMMCPGAVRGCELLPA